MKKALQMTQSCQTLVQATESDMKEFQMQKKPSTKSGKCLHACLMESIGLVILSIYLGARRQKRTDERENRSGTKLF